MASNYVAFSHLLFFSIIFSTFFVTFFFLLTSNNRHSCSHFISVDFRSENFVCEQIFVLRLCSFYPKASSCIFNGHVNELGTTGNNNKKRFATKYSFARFGEMVGRRAQVVKHAHWEQKDAPKHFCLRIHGKYTMFNCFSHAHWIRESTQFMYILFLSFFIEMKTWQFFVPFRCASLICMLFFFIYFDAY